MLFPTTDFAIFFALVFLASWLLQPTPTRWKIFMVAASYFFYGWWDWHFILLLGACTVVSQVGAELTYHVRTYRSKRWAMAVSVAALLGLLGWFKYYGFLALNVDNTLHALGVHNALPLLQVTLPVGISFFTFMAISYIVDVYRGIVKPAGWLDYAVYLSFFPHLVAGPIVRERELMPQIRKRRDPRKVDFSRAAWLIFSGLFLKVVISSYLATQIVDPVFSNPSQHSSPEILFAIYGYAVQIFSDFAGYTNIAIGIALLLGFEFPQNFEAPYTSQSIQEFWRRWHMTLSRWLRDYVYIPLGGNRRGRVRTYVNLMATMLLGGLWHGASWTFVIWGGLMGGALCWEHYQRERRTDLRLPDPPYTPRRAALRRLGTFNFVCLGWVFFRAGSFGTAMTMLWRLVVGGLGPNPLITWGVLLAIVIGIGVQYVPDDVGFKVQDAFSRIPATAQGLLLGVGLFMITTRFVLRAWPRSYTSGSDGALPPGPRPRRRRREERRMIPAGKVLGAMMIGFLVWLLLASPSLKRTAEASPFGIRRTASIIVLTPFDAISDLLRLSRVDAAARSALGRDTGGNDTGSGGPAGIAPKGVDASPPPTTPPPSTKRGDAKPPPSPLPTIRKPSKAHPLTVLAIGDSIGIDLGLGLQRVMGDTGYYKVIVDGKISTGLARPDYFNWPAQLELDIRKYHPDIVVALFGLNDPQGMRTSSRTLVTFSKPWFDEYSRRVDKILELGTADGRRMMWAGGPIVSNAHLRHDMNALNGVYRKQTRLYPNAFYFNTWKYTSSNGTYTAFLTDPNGNHFLARTGDGDHFTNQGEDYVARIAYAQMRSVFLHGHPVR